MYLPRALISKLYTHLQQTRHPLSPPVLILVALEPDALCACRILTRLLKHDYIPHKIQPVAGYTDLEKAGRELVMPMMESQGGSGGVVVCLGVGGMVDLGPLLGLEPEGDDAPYSGVEVWVMDAHRPWNLGNVFGGFPLDPATEVSSSYQSRSPAGVDGGKITRVFNPGKGGIIVFDDGDIDEEMETERNAYLALIDMPDIDDDGDDLGDTDDEDEDENFENTTQEPAHAGQKRKSWSDGEDDSDDDRPRQRRRSNSVCIFRYLALYATDIRCSPALSRNHRDAHNKEGSSLYNNLILGCQAIQLSPPPEHNRLQVRRPAHYEDDYYECEKRMKPFCSITTRSDPLSLNRYRQ
jgi:cell division control protein 45